MYRLRDIYPRAALQNLYNALIILQFSYFILCWGSVISENHSLHILQKRALRLITNSRYISHTEPLCKELRVLKVFDMFYVAIWKFYYKLMHNDLPKYFSTMKPNLPTVCRRYEIRAPVFHLPVIRPGAPNSAKFRGGCRGPAKIRQRGVAIFFLLVTR